VGHSKDVFAAPRMSPLDAVDGSSTGTEVPWMWVLLRPPRFGGAKYASGHDNRSPPGARRRSCASAGQTIAQDGVLKCCRDLLFLA
jgi:hypothetical protein